MKTSSLLLYIFVAAINVFLFLPVFFNPIIVTPLHLLLCLLSYKWLFRQKIFRSTLSKTAFAFYPIASQMILVLIYITSDADNKPGLLLLLDNVLVMILILICIVEFAVLYKIYSNFLKTANKLS